MLCQILKKYPNRFQVLSHFCSLQARKMSQMGYNIQWLTQSEAFPVCFLLQVMPLSLTQLARNPHRNWLIYSGLITRCHKNVNVFISRKYNPTFSSKNGGNKFLTNFLHYRLSKHFYLVDLPGLVLLPPTV